MKLETALSVYKENLYRLVDKTNLEIREACVLSSLIAQDYFEALGFDTKLVEVVLCVQKLNEAKHLERMIQVGNPLDSRQPGRWNGHLVLQVGEHIIDSTMGQASRPQHDIELPDLFDFAIRHDCQQELIDLIDNKPTIVDFDNKCLASFVADNERVMISYFEVNTTGGYVGAKDTLPSRRSKIVDKLLLIARR
jgi:uncharacterized protein (UPF0335 family)